MDCADERAVHSGSAADAAGILFTKERVTLEAQNSEKPSVPFAKQLKAIFTDKYMLIILCLLLIFAFGASIKNLSLVYFCNYVLGT